MSALFTTALSAAKDAASSQHYPHGALYVVATPIGNLADISLRALHVLGLVDAMACEDTRHTHGLLRSYGIAPPAGGLMALHQHNEAEAAQQLIDRLRAGERVAYVSDAGTPAVSDPGARLAAAARAAGLRVVPLPGASSVTALLSVAGAVGSDEATGFRFVGFLPSKAQAREQAIRALAGDAQTVVLLEAPHRIEPLAAALAALGDRLVTVGRELTKQFEEVVTLSAADLSAWLAGDANRARGEFALLLHPRVAAEPQDADNPTVDKALGLLLPELPMKTAVRIAAEWTGVARNAVYARALALKRAGEVSDGDLG